MDIPNILFYLIRLALGTRADETDFSALTNADWKSLIDLSFDQGVAAIAVDGLQKRLEVRGERLGNEVRGERLEVRDEGLELLDSPELEDLKYEWFGEVFAREEDYNEQVRAIRQLARLWAENGLKVYALKGLSFAQYYPVPEHRYSCDFDCNVRFASSNLPAWDVADRIAKENGIAVDDDQSKHSRFVVNGAHSLRQVQGKLGSGQVPVENHRHIIGVNGSRKQKRFDSYLQGLLNDSGRALMPDLPLVAPCWLFNALFCIAHAQVHFLEEDGIVLKHVLDWVQIRKAPEAVAYREQFEKDIDRFGLRKFFDAIDGVGDLIEVRGERLEVREGFATKTMVRQAHQPTKTGVRLMLEDILAPKDVRHYKSRFLAHLNILRMLWANRWKYRHYSDTNAFAIMWRYIYGHFFDRDNVEVRG